MRRRRQHRAQPALRRRARQLAEHLDAATDDRLLLVPLEIGDDIVLGIGVGGDLVARLQHLLDRLRCQFHGPGVGTERRGHGVGVEYLHEPPYSRAAAIGAPGHGSTVVGAGFERGRLHREWRPLVARPSLQEAGHGHRDPGPVRPREAVRFLSHDKYLDHQMRRIARISGGTFFRALSRCFRSRDIERVCCGPHHSL